VRRGKGGVRGARRGGEWEQWEEEGHLWSALAGLVELLGENGGCSDWWTDMVRHIISKEVPRLSEVQRVQRHVIA
jgi:hypothetical protein